MSDRRNQVEETDVGLAHVSRWVSLSLIILAAAAFVCFGTLKGGIPQRLAHSVVGSPRKQTLPHWSLTFSDNFDGSAGSLPSSANWITYSGAGYQGELERYTSSSSNVRLDGRGHLLLIARRAEDGWTSGEVQTKEDFVARQGTSLLVQVRVKLPNGGQGYWPAVWAVAESFRSNPASEPGAGEVDLAEAIDDRPSVSQFFHCGFKLVPTDCVIGHPYANRHLFVQASGEAGWHVYSWEWVNEGRMPYIEMSIDGVVQMKIYRSEVTKRNWDAALDHPYYLIMNLAIGGWAGKPNSSSKDVGIMSIGFVRVFES